MIKLIKKEKVRKPMPQNIKSQNLSIMMTDIQGYTDASSSSSREEIINLIRRHNELMIPVIKFYGGNIVKQIGDAFLCTFQSATDAVVCAIIIQILLKDLNERQMDESKKMNLRVVVNTGDVSLENNDIYGDAVNVTARMEGLPCFPGGTIGISESTYLLMNRNEIVAEKIGPKELKGIPEPITVYAVPLDKQKLTSIPARLSQLVERAVGEKKDMAYTAVMKDFTDSMNTFLEEKNWGENIGKVQEKVTEHLKTAQQHISKKLGQKSVLETKKQANFQDASIASRSKSFFIDLLIFGILLLVLNLGWMIGQRVLFGKTVVETPDYMSGKKFEYSFEDKGYLRKMGALELIIDLNISYPVIPMILILGLCWKISGATPGQRIIGTAVVMENGDQLDTVTAFKRAAFFVPSVLLLGLGALLILIGEKKTLYDKCCSTRVIE